MTVDEFLTLFVKEGTPVIIVNQDDVELDSFTWKKGICAWQGDSSVDTSYIDDSYNLPRLAIKVENKPY